MPRLIFILIFILVPGTIFSQETIINLGISQPRELKVNAGVDLVFGENESIILGSNLEVTGGTPSFVYSWRDDDSDVGSTPTVTVSLPGEYSILVSDSRNCSDSDTINVFITSIDKLQYSDSIRIFPNPAQDNLFIQTFDNNPVILVEILTLSGKQIKMLPPSAFSGFYSLKISGLEQGFYLIRIETKKYSVLRSFVKN